MQPVVYYNYHIVIAIIQFTFTERFTVWNNNLQFAMASKKKESEGIALLSMYNDEDDEMEDLNEEDEAKDAGNYDGEGEYSKESDRRATDSEENMSPLPPYEESTLTTSPYRQSQPLDFQRKKGGKLTIVDYGHDEIALSPEAEVLSLLNLFIFTNSKLILENNSWRFIQRELVRQITNFFFFV